MDEQQGAYELRGQEPIRFYRASEKPYGAFSNLFRREVVVLGRRFATAEHAYQSLKPREASVREWLLSAPSPSLLSVAAHEIPSDGLDTAGLVGSVGNALLGFHTRPGWSRLRYPWMLQCVTAKFKQHEDLRTLLLGTGLAEIVEAGRIDDDAGRRWGVVNGRGHNYLGRMLMRVRATTLGIRHEDTDLDERLEQGREQLAEAVKQCW